MCDWGILGSLSTEAVSVSSKTVILPSADPPSTTQPVERSRIPRLTSLPKHDTCGEKSSMPNRLMPLGGAGGSDATYVLESDISTPPAESESAIAATLADYLKPVEIMMAPDDTGDALVGETTPTSGTDDSTPRRQVRASHIPVGRVLSGSASDRRDSSASDSSTGLSLTERHNLSKSSTFRPGKAVSTLLPRKAVSTSTMATNKATSTNTTPSDTPACDTLPSLNLIEFSASSLKVTPDPSSSGQHSIEVTNLADSSRHTSSQQPPHSLSMTPSVCGSVESSSSVAGAKNGGDVSAHLREDDTSLESSGRAKGADGDGGSEAISGQDGVPTSLPSPRPTHLDLPDKEFIAGAQAQLEMVTPALSTPGVGANFCLPVPTVICVDSEPIQPSSCSIGLETKDCEVDSNSKSNGSEAVKVPPIATLPPYDGSVARISGSRESSRSVTPIDLAKIGKLA